MLVENFGPLVATYHGDRRTRARLHRQAGKYLIVMSRDGEERVHAVTIGRADRDQAKAFAQTCAQHFGMCETWPTDEEVDDGFRMGMQSGGELE